MATSELRFPETPSRWAMRSACNPCDLFGADPWEAVADMPGPSSPDAGAEPAKTDPAETLPPSGPDATPALGNPGEATAALWKGYWDACTRFEAELDRYCARARLDGVDCRPATPDTGVGGRIRLAESMARDLVGLAARRFRGPGCPPLKIRESDWVRRFVYEPVRDPVDGSQQDAFFDPIALWEALEEEFGGEKGMALSYRDAAAKIRGCFGLRAGVVVQQRRQGVVLSMPVWLDSNHRGSLSVSTQQEFYALCDALRAFAAWADDDGTLLAGLDVLLEHFGWSSFRPVTSREKIHLCAALSVVTYKNRFEFVMASALAEQLQLFLGLYAPIADGLASPPA